jgi:outer membrane protein TolC
MRQAESLLATTEATVPTMLTMLKLSISALGWVPGEQPGALLEELSSSEPIPSTPPTVPVGLPSELRWHRADVRRAERQLAAATTDIDVQTAELFPKFSLTGTTGLQSASTSDFLTDGSCYWSFGPQLPGAFSIMAVSMPKVSDLQLCWRSLTTCANAILAVFSGSSVLTSGFEPTMASPLM